MIDDVRVSLRTLRKNPGFFVAASFTLAIGIGANTAVFSLLDALLLRTLPVERPEELVVLGPGALGLIGRSDRPQVDHFSFPQYEALRADNNGVLAEVAAAATFNTTVFWGDPAEAGERRNASCQLVTGSYFTLLGVRPFAGRLLTPDDDKAPGASPLVVVSYDFWQGPLGADSEVVGSTIRLNDEPYTIVGVVGPLFHGHVVESRTDIWAPLSMQSELTRRSSMLEPTRPYMAFWLNILMRLRPGVSVEKAESAVNVRLQQIFIEQAGGDLTAERREDIEKTRVGLTPAARGLSALRAPIQGPLALLWAATGLVLLIACANLANLLLARASERRSEVGIRQALGASSLRLLRGMLTESALLATVGTVLGVLTARWLIPVMQVWLQDMRGAESVNAGMDARSLGFASTVGVLTVFLFGLAPSLWAVRGSVMDTLRGGGRTTALGRGEVRAKGLLVGGQFALSLVLLSVTGLFLKTLGELRAADLGLDGANVVTFQIDPRRSGYPLDVQPRMRRRMLEQIETIPGVESAAFTGSIPLSGNYAQNTITVVGYEPSEDESMNVIQEWASLRYFHTLGIHLLEGRLFAPEDRRADAVVVNRAFAERFFRGRSAVNGVIAPGKRIIGVVANVRQVNVRDQPPPMIYQPTTDHPNYLEDLIVRSVGPKAEIAQSVRAAVREVAPGMLFSDGFGTIEGLLDRGVTIERMLTRLVGAFAGVALLLSALGLYGVSSYLIGRRTGEIGVRQALGATPADVRALVVKRAAAVLVISAACGVLGSWAAGRFVSGLLYEVHEFEWTIASAALLALTAAAVPAVCVPAWRAGRVSPAEALRYE